MKTTLAAICTFTLLATGYFSLSLVILHPPRANYQEWFLSAALFGAQTALTLTALFAVIPKSLNYLALKRGGTVR